MKLILQDRLVLCLQNGCVLIGTTYEVCLKRILLFQ